MRGSPRRDEFPQPGAFAEPDTNAATDDGDAKTRIPPDALALTVREFRAALRIGHTLAHQMIREGQVGSFTIGRARRIVRADVERLVADRSSSARR